MEILIILLLVMLNGVFALSEIAVVSAREVRLRQMAEEGNRSAALALQLTEDPGRFLSTVQVGITLIGILAGVFGGATVAQSLEKRLSPLPYSEALAYGLVVLLTTYLSLVIGELVPKQVALRNPERFAALVAYPMRWLSILMDPAVRVLSVSTNLLMQLGGGNDSEDPPVTEADITALVEQGTEAGIFEEIERTMVSGVFRLDNVRADAVMTPRTELDWLNTEATQAELVQVVTSSQHTRFPVCRSTLDQVEGTVHVGALMRQWMDSQQMNPQAVMQPAVFVPESLALSAVLKQIKHPGQHMALVIGEFGGIQGVITVGDIVEELLGDIEPETPQAILREDGAWLMDGLLPVHELEARLDVADLPDRSDYQTLGGFVFAQLGRIPVEGDAFGWGGWRFEVMAMNDKRVAQVLVKRDATDASIIGANML